MLWAQRQGSENEEVKCALRKINAVRHCFSFRFYREEYTLILCRSTRGVKSIVVKALNAEVKI
jgi:hypothetical protein